MTKPSVPPEVAVDAGSAPLRSPDVRSYNARQGRMSALTTDTFDRLGPHLLLDPACGFDPAHVFGAATPVVVEIGCGFGEATTAMAAAEPAARHRRHRRAHARHRPTPAAGRGRGPDERASGPRRRGAVPARPGAPRVAGRGPHLLPRPVAQGAPPQAQARPAAVRRPARLMPDVGSGAALRHRLGAVRARRCSTCSARARCSPTRLRASPRDRRGVR